MAVITAAVIAAGAGAATSAYNSSQASKQADANRSQQQAFLDQSTQANQDAKDQAQGFIDSLYGMSEEDKIAAFGDKLNPEAFLYNPVIIGQSQHQTIQDNMRESGGAIALSDRVNSSIWQNDLNRIRTLMPGYDQYSQQYLGITNSLQQGKLPYEDVMGILGDSGSLAGSVGAPGGSRATTLKDLGISRLSAMEQGNSMFTNFVNMAQVISPNEKQMTPQQSFLTPSERLNADIMQHSLTQQGNASAEIARASPDPAASAITNADMAMQMAMLGSGYTPQMPTGSTYNSGLASSVNSGINGILSAFMGSQNKGYGNTSFGTNGSNGSYGSGYNLDYGAVPSLGGGVSSPSAYGYNPSYSAPAHSVDLSGGQDFGSTSPSIGMPTNSLQNMTNTDPYGNAVMGYYGGDLSQTSGFNVLTGM